MIEDWNYLKIIELSFFGLAGGEFAEDVELARDCRGIFDWLNTISGNTSYLLKSRKNLPNFILSIDDILIRVIDCTR